MNRLGYWSASVIFLIALGLTSTVMNASNNNNKTNTLSDTINNNGLECQ
jgi:hypothetical protein